METQQVIDQILKNETLKVIYERRAIRKFKDKGVDRELIEQLLEAARMAPSAMNRQPWKFYVLTKKETIQSFSKEITKTTKAGILKTGLKEVVKTLVHPGNFHLKDGLQFFKSEDPIFHGAPVVIFITSPKNNEWAGLDIGMCSQNIMLAAKSLGLDSCPVGLAKFVEQSAVYDQLKAPNSEQVNLAIVIGYGDETPEVHERLKDNAVFI
ncbi:MAG: nitroreductase family protein [Bacteroidia bacterium]